MPRVKQPVGRPALGAVVGTTASRQKSAAHDRKPTRADEMPLVSVLSKHTMQRAIALMQDDVSYQETERELCNARQAIKEELAHIAQQSAIPGMRWGNLVVYYRGMKTKRTLSKKLLVEWLDVETINRCYKTSKEYLDLQVRDVRAPEPVNHKEEEEDDAGE